MANMLLRDLEIEFQRTVQTAFISAIHKKFSAVKRMVDFEFTEEQELFRKAVREWCEKNLPIEKTREMDTKGAFHKSYLEAWAKWA
jgi:hypothetical protein